MKKLKIILWSILLFVTGCAPGTTVSFGGARPQPQPQSYTIMNPNGTMTNCVGQYGTFSCF